MSIVRLLGSFPNSQIKPRSPVRESEMINLNLPLAGGEQQILAADIDRIKAIIKNKESSAGDAFVDYTNGPSDGFTLKPGAALTIDGGGDNVFVTPVGGNVDLEIDNRVG